MSYNYRGNPSITKKSLNGRICLILTRNDFELISQLKYTCLSKDLQGLLIGLARAKHIKKIDLGIIESSFSETSLIKLFFNIRYLFDAFARKLSNFIDILEQILSSRPRNSFNYSESEYIPFRKKLHHVCAFSQVINSFYTVTKPNSELSYGLYDFFLRGSGLKIETELFLPLYSRLGLLSLHHGDSRFIRGLPVGFWEVARERTSGIIAQLVNSELDAGHIVAAARIGTIFNPRMNTLSIYSLSADCIQMAFNNIYSSAGALSDYWNYKDYVIPYGELLFRSPSPLFRIWISSICLMRSIIRLPRRLLLLLIRQSNVNTNIRWKILLTKNPHRRLNRWLELSSTSNDWYADPFVVSIGSRLFLLAEKFVYSESKGIISAHEITQCGDSDELMLGEEQILLSNSLHLSFPFCFERDGSSYMIPENGRNGCILYLLDFDIGERSNSLRCSEVKHLLTGDWRDPILVRRDGVDYLIVSKCHSQQASVLNVFMSRDILKDPLVPHPQSPCLIDCNLGRNGGRTFFLSSQGQILIRPSQKNFPKYGAGIIYSTLDLSPTHIYISELSGFNSEGISQTKFSYTHHIERNHSIVAIDVQDKNLFF